MFTLKISLPDVEQITSLRGPNLQDHANFTKYCNMGVRSQTGQTSVSIQAASLLTTD